jgi:pyruvate/2-oxoglutarate dehydrogenase complex dihydrolipoamide acyltransferase (E2) component
MRTQVTLPELGAADARVSAWFAEPGDLVYEGDRLVEVLVQGATFDVAAPATGRLAERAALPEDHVVTGQVLGEIESDPFQAD